MMVNETLTLKVLFICKKLLKIIDNTVIFLQAVTALNNVLIFLKKKDYTEEFLAFIRN